MSPCKKIYLHTVTGPIDQLEEEEAGLLITAVRMQSRQFRVMLAHYVSKDDVSPEVIRHFNEVIARCDALETKLHGLLDC